MRTRRTRFHQFGDARRLVLAGCIGSSRGHPLRSRSVCEQRLDARRDILDAIGAGEQRGLVAQDTGRRTASERDDRTWLAMASTARAQTARAPRSCERGCRSCPLRPRARGRWVPGDPVTRRGGHDPLVQPFAVPSLGCREEHVANQMEGHVASLAHQLGELNDEVRTLPGGNLTDEAHPRRRGPIQPRCRQCGKTSLIDSAWHDSDRAASRDCPRAFVVAGHPRCQCDGMRGTSDHHDHGQPEDGVTREGVTKVEQHRPRRPAHRNRRELRLAGVDVHEVGPDGTNRSGDAAARFEERGRRGWPRESPAQRGRPRIRMAGRAIPRRCHARPPFVGKDRLHLPPTSRSARARFERRRAPGWNAPRHPGPSSGRHAECEVPRAGYDRAPL